MKLIDLILGARRRTDADKAETSARFGNDSADRSSMAELVRLLKEADDAQGGRNARPA